MCAATEDIRALKEEVTASRKDMKRIFAILQTVCEDVAFLKEANRSSSNSGSRLYCPLNCGADFGKVGRCMRCRCKYLMQCR